MSLRNFFRTLWHGAAPEIANELLISGRQDSNTQRKLTTNIKWLIENYDNVKIGKSGDTEIRTDQKDYRGTYTYMYLLYESTSRANVQHYEAYYIDRFYDHIDNIAKGSGGKMRSYNGYYYLYAVVADN
jgi:hypothetical protein